MSTWAEKLAAWLDLGQPPAMALARVVAAFDRGDISKEELRDLLDRPGPPKRVNSPGGSA